MCQTERGENKKKSLWGGFGFVAFLNKMVTLLLVNVRNSIISFLTGLSVSACTSCINPLNLKQLNFLIPWPVSEFESYVNFNSGKIIDMILDPSVCLNLMVPVPRFPV